MQRRNGKNMNTHVRPANCQFANFELRNCYPFGVGGVPGRGEVDSGVGCLHWTARGAPLPLCLQHVCKIVGVRFWKEWHPAVWL